MKPACKTFFFAIALSTLLFGCAPKEFARVVFDMGVDSFKEKGKIYSETIPKDISTCYEETLQIFKKMQATPYRGSLKQRFIVALHFHNSFGDRCIDTTEVAVFFEELDSGTTKVEVSSLNFSLSEFVAEKIFEGLQG